MTNSVDLAAGESYVPAHFRLQDPQAIAALIAEHPFATLVINGRSWPMSVQLPFLRFGPVDQPDHWRFEAHLARANPVVSEVLATPGATPGLLLFSGPDAYINPYWYTDSVKTSAPTWNYQAIHLRGSLTLRDNPPDAWLDQHLKALIDSQQQRIGAGEFDYHQLPEQQRAGMLAAIIGLEFIPQRIDAIEKINQNKTPADRAGVIHGLQAGGDPMQTAMAALMANK